MIPQVGQKLFVAYKEPRNQGREHEVEVLHVGRKWVTIATPAHLTHAHMHTRFDMTDPRWPVDAGGFSWAQRVWPSREAWQREVGRDRAYMAFRRALEFVAARLSPDVSAEDVRTAARALGFGGEFERQLEILRTKR
jgi:hypothetical protein